VFNAAPVLIQAKEVDTGAIMVSRPMLKAMQDNAVLGYDALEFDPFARVLTAILLKWFCCKSGLS
jgi:hypothetical protein